MSRKKNKPVRVVRSVAAGAVARDDRIRKDLEQYPFRARHTGYALDE